MTDTYAALLRDVTVSASSTNVEAEKAIISDVSLAVNKGEWISLIGANGSGKSTLLKLIAGFPLNVTAGSVRHANELAKEAGLVTPIVMQQPEAGIIGATPWEDVVAMLERSAAEPDGLVAKAEQSLQAAGLGERMRQPVETLSGGQKQLTAVAGSLAADAPMLLLDEITAMLDPHMSRYVWNEARRLHRKGVAVVWATQRTEELVPGDRTIVMHEGSVVYDGDAKSLFARSSGGKGQSIAERYGLPVPYVIRTAWELEKEGILLKSLPFTPEQLAEAVNEYGR